MRAEHGLSREECHLSVVGDRTQFPVGGSVIARENRTESGEGTFFRIAWERLSRRTGYSDSAEVSQPNEEFAASYRRNSFPSPWELVMGLSYVFGAEHESNLEFQIGSTDRICSARSIGRWSSARASSVGANNGGAGAARSWNFAECIESRACPAAADNHTRRLEVQSG